MQKKDWAYWTKDKEKIDETEEEFIHRYIETCRFLTEMQARYIVSVYSVKALDQSLRYYQSDGYRCEQIVRKTDNHMTKAAGLIMRAPYLSGG